MKKLYACVIGILLLTAVSYAQEEKSAVTYKTKISTAIAWPLEAIVSVTEHIKVPVLHFPTPFTQGNNITFKIGADISPVSLEGRFDMVWTPIAFLELYTGAVIGSGWNIPALKAQGLELNEEDTSGKSKYTRIDFQRAFYSFNIGGAVQFDLAALIPGEWNHLVVRIDQFGIYKALTGTDNLTTWVWKNTDENRNGWRYNASYILGYQMPIPLNFIAMRVETEKSFFSVPAGADKRLWGEDRFKVTFGPLFNFKINEIFDILLVLQFKTNPVLTTSKDTFYQKRYIDTSKPDGVVFKRIAVLFDVTLKHK